ncbi:MAG: MCP four helix bundle domain-containing protein [Defluviitaleaceae bacterium]|nr:MCP four helix bundle domain-containing protein [Defluviitaleaceae bacterium]
MKISKRLLFGFVMAIILSVVVGFVGMVGMRSLYESGIFMYEEQDVGMEHFPSEQPQDNRFKH